MTYMLSARERTLLDHLQLDHDIYQIRGQLPVGTGATTLQRLTELGLLETGVVRFRDTGWRLTDNGWRCMYGKTLAEIDEAGVPHRPLEVWSWPPTLSVTHQLKRPRLATLPPRLAELPARLKTIK